MATTQPRPREQDPLATALLTLIVRMLPTRSGSLINASQGLRTIRADRQARADALALLAVPAQRRRESASTSRVLPVCVPDEHCSEVVV